ncbi:LytR/AlgR family response regulator transcription factor [Heyndrickxia ginsengihumi]|uniref:Response regulator transcription factor n=1 Tax=Heyndrickxia ginsengihumi TaxID=363870 RepID=A0A0A6Y3G5_9BACI|nr:LytTR family DNA-binding domain-containing protein [Heyndrickxia ginsengihumi]KHD86777.1 two-component response regulator [Heyndrickxia ginsengihumi]MBE6185050.1 response regulator transcription factor [Bacillus sp. (in: firmicutes)]MCM3022253.1 LytTR family DNA-binding domain-containing protein [Heyndrickxia ginsengihumi]NEY18486.1 response regulator transcription factor [Heyndrickxia ginsengihumi]
MLRAFVVDDEVLARDELIYLLKKTGKVKIVGEAESVQDAIDKMSALAVDVLFVDMMLTNELGLELVERVKQSNQKLQIVFATAYDDYAVKAFDLNAADYLLKPFDEKRVQQAVEKMIANDRRNETKDLHVSVNGKPVDKLAITVDERMIILPIVDLLYIESIDGSTIVTTNTEKYTVAETLVNVEKKLQMTSITRVHRSYLVNLEAIVEIRPWFHSTYNLMMKDGAKIPVSRTYKHVLKQFIHI